MTTFITTIEGDIITVLTAVWQQTVVELQKLEGEILTIIKTDIQALVDAAESSKTIEELETELLNLWAANKSEIISALSSGALQFLIAAAKTAVAVV